jgi:hypothetical protein
MSPIAGYFGSFPRYLFVQRPCFFFGHCRHTSPLSRLEQPQIYIPAFHGMKYVDCLFVLCIIHNFQQFTTAIKADKEVFVRFGVPYVIIQPSVNGIADVRVRAAMPKGRFVKLNDDLHSAFHTLILTQNRRK